LIKNILVLLFFELTTMKAFGYGGRVDEITFAEVAS